MENNLEQTVNDMEQAASILLVRHTTCIPNIRQDLDAFYVFQNPFQSSRDLLKIAENTFINFAKSKLELPTCFRILENTRNELVRGASKSAQLGSYNIKYLFRFFSRR